MLLVVILHKINPVFTLGRCSASHTACKYECDAINDVAKWNMKFRWVSAQFITYIVAFYSILPFLFAFVNESKRSNACALRDMDWQQRWCVMRQIKYSATCGEIMTGLACQRRSRIIVPDAVLLYCGYRNRRQLTIICKNTEANQQNCIYTSELLSEKQHVVHKSRESCYK